MTDVFRLEGDSALIFVDLKNNSVSLLDVTGAAYLAGRMIVQSDSTFFNRVANETFVAIKYANAVGSFSRLDGCNGFLEAEQLATAFIFRTIENSTLENVFLSPLGSDASCCGTERCVGLPFCGRRNFHTSFVFHDDAHVSVFTLAHMHVYHMCCCE